MVQLMYEPILLVLEQLKAEAILIVNNNDTDDIDAWKNYIAGLDYMINNDPLAVLPNRPPQYK